MCTNLYAYQNVVSVVRACIIKMYLFRESACRLLMCTPYPQKDALNNEKCHLCKMQEMSMPVCLCALFCVCLHAYIVCVGLVVCAHVCLCMCVCTEVSVKVFLSVMMERQDSCHLTQCY